MEKVWGTSLLHQVVLISSIKLISRSMKKMRNFPHCFHATQGKNKRRGEKEQQET